MKIVNKSGYTLHGFIQGEEQQLLAEHKPVTASVIVINVGQNTLFGYNLNREQWELPGGRIETDETPLECAHRELEEESSQTIPELVFAGLAHMQRPSGDYKYTALYHGQLDQLQDFAENDEWNRIKQREFNEDDGADLIHVELVSLLKE